ncbi:hypothetical protein CRN32_12415 [Vibrio vulnificus]|nr:hypothetical protein BFX35_00980 [Vibrio cholerae]POC52939.1 hypothetical protein CRN32_12415 [Vibrio vulnificus]
MRSVTYVSVTFELSKRQELLNLAKPYQKLDYLFRNLFCLVAIELCDVSFKGYFTDKSKDP